MSNKKLGNQFENYTAQYLFNKGFWVLRIPDTYAGQPVDIITVKNKKAYLIECKNCTNNVFETKRIEPNQHATFHLWEEAGNGDGYIAISQSPIPNPQSPIPIPHYISNINLI